MGSYMAYTLRREHIAESGLYISTAREYIAESGCIRISTAGSLLLSQVAIHNCGTEKEKVDWPIPPSLTIG